VVVVAACGVELSLAGRAARVGIEVGGDGEGGAAGAAEDGFFVEFGGGPGLNRMAGESDVAVLAGVKKTAALHLDGDDIQRGMVVEAAGLRIELETEDFWGMGAHEGIKGGRRIAEKVSGARSSGRSRRWRYQCSGGMCYKSRAVNGAAKQEGTPIQRERAGLSAEHALPAKVEGSVGVPGEDASRYCPVCSQRLESRRCKLICPVCGYYMSCADYY